MSQRLADVMADYLTDNVSTDYVQSNFDAVDRFPFNNPDAKILLTRQDGAPTILDAVRVHTVLFQMYTRQNAEGSDHNTLINEALAAYEYLRANPAVNDDTRIRTLQDVTGPFYTGQNRIMYQFSYEVYSD